MTTITDSDPGTAARRTAFDRREIRREFSPPLVVRDAVSGCLLGHLTNLSSSGMMLRTDVPIPQGGRLSVVIELPPTPAGRRELDVSMRCRWCNRAVGGRSFEAGFRFAEMSFRQKLLLETFLKNESPQYAEIADTDAAQSATTSNE